LHLRVLVVEFQTVDTDDDAGNVLDDKLVVVGESSLISLQFLDQNVQRLVNVDDQGFLFNVVVNDVGTDNLELTSSASSTGAEFVYDTVAGVGNATRAVRASASATASASARASESGTIFLNVFQQQFPIDV